MGAAPKLNVQLSPRGLRREEAAKYISVSASLFDQMVKDGRMPQPKRINSMPVWDRLGIDQAFEALPGGCDGSDGSNINPWDHIFERIGKS